MVANQEHNQVMKQQFSMLYDTKPSMKTVLLCLHDMKSPFNAIGNWAQKGEIHFNENLYLQEECELATKNLVALLRDYAANLAENNVDLVQEIDALEKALSCYWLLKRGDVGRNEAQGVDWQCVKRLYQYVEEFFSAWCRRKSIDELQIMNNEELIAVSKELVDVVNLSLRLYVKAALSGAKIEGRCPCLVTLELRHFLTCLKDEFGIRGNYCSKVRLVRVEEVAEKLYKRHLAGTHPVIENWMLESF